jgi:nitroreductase
MQNDTLTLIRNRRSVRNFKKEQIREEELQAVLEAGLYAPSARNEQPWHFTVIQNREILDSMTSIAKEAFKNTEIGLIQSILNDENFDFFYHAPTVIIISGDKNSMSPHASCAAAAENIIIAAESIGLGSCWLNMPIRMVNSEAGSHFKKELGIPEDFIPLYSIALGYKEGSPGEAAPRKKNSINYIK